MAAQRQLVYFTENEKKTCKVVKVKVTSGSNITLGQVLVYYDFEETKPEDGHEANETCTSSSNNNSKLHQHVIRASCAGTVEQVLVKEGDSLIEGTPILEYTVCGHPTVMKDMCAECGADLREVKKRNQTAAVAMVHNIPELMVSMEEAKRLGKADEKRLLQDRKLVLLVDLDQTLIHTTNDVIPANIKDVFHFQLHGNNSSWYHTRLRPYTKEFLKSMSALYELHICTFGSRTYAHKIAKFLDEEGRYFSHRILSRDECFSSHSKMANLKALFPCGDHMVVIIDDREDVWNFAPNLIHVRPYHFFQHTGDINAPPGLSKKEFDDKEGYDFSTLKAKEKEGPKTTEVETKLDSVSSMPKSQKDQQKNGNTDGHEQQCNGATGNSNDDHLSSEAPLEGVVANDGTMEKNTEQKDNVCKNDEVSETPSQAFVEEVETAEGTQEAISKGNESSGPESETATEADLTSKEVLSHGAKSDAKASVSSQEHSASEFQTEEEEVEVLDTDDYLLHLQDILRTIHHAYYEIYDEKDKKTEVPDMKRILPYARRKVLQNVRIVFSGVVPTNVQQDKSRPYLVARSLGAFIMSEVNESTTHVIAARLGTAKLNEAKKYKKIRVVTPDWLWSCAERWEHVDERLFPLNMDTAAVRRKPPAHCTSPDVALQLAMAAGTKEEPEASIPVYDRVTGKRVFRKASSKYTDKGKSWASARSTQSERPQRRFSETFNPLMTLSSEEIADMDREVEDILHGIDETDDDESEPEPESVREPQAPPEKRFKHQTEIEQEHALVIGDVSKTNDPENDSLLNQARHGEPIPQFKGINVDYDDDEDRADDEEEPNAVEFDEMEQDEDVLDDSEWCLAGQALEREFLSGEED